MTVRSPANSPPRATLGSIGQKGPIVGQVPLHALRRGAHFTHGVEGQGVLTG